MLDAYVPLYPYLLIEGERRLPTEGYFYHFNHTTLIQEYCIKGEGRWAFWATESDKDSLSDERRIDRDQSAILMLWKQGGEIVDSQYLVYLEPPLMDSELEDMNEEWLSEYGMKVDIPQLVVAAKAQFIHPTQQEATDDSVPEEVYHDSNTKYLGKV